jgi:pimeloyl-ACP methyl ester carboxylesterase
MVLWGGLQPIASQVVLDALTVIGLTYATLTSGKAGTSRLTRSMGILMASCLVTVSTTGLTTRWTLTLPMLPLLFLQSIRHIQLAWSKSGQQQPQQQQQRLITRTIAFLSILCILMGATLSVLFPAVELPPIKGPYNVGVVDFFLPVEMSCDDESSKNSAASSCETYSHLPVRLLYPTLDKAETIPYLRPELALEFCRQMMRLGGPPPLKDLDWMLHTWRLTGLPMKDSANLADRPEPFPVVVFSHGLGGSAHLYSYQTMALAAHGSVVLSLNHQDGSAPVVQMMNGTYVTFDFDLSKLWEDGKYVEYARARRAGTDRRVRELVAATESLRRLNDYDVAELHRAGLSLRGRLQIGHTSFMGHSFGGATALTAAKRRPDLVRAVIAHEPAIDWMPDDARRSLFEEDRLEGSSHEFSGGTGGFGESKDELETNSLHDIPSLFLYSHEWTEKKWGASHIIHEMRQKGRLGPKDGSSDYAIIKDAHHNEFSDTCMLTPLWLAREVGVTGKRNPHSTAKEIEERTRAFLDAVHRDKRT